jgi:hypothetical protein
MWSGARLLLLILRAYGSGAILLLLGGREEIVH